MTKFRGLRFSLAQFFTSAIAIVAITGSAQADTETGSASLELSRPTVKSAVPSDDVISESIRLRGEHGLDDSRATVEDILLSRGLSPDMTQSELSAAVNQYGFIGTKSEESTITKREELVNAIGTELPDLAKQPGFAGHFLDNAHGGTLVVQFKRGTVPHSLQVDLESAASRVGALADDVKIREVGYSSDELTSEMDAWWDEGAQTVADNPIVAISEDPRTNGITIDVNTSESVQSLSMKRRSVPTPVTFRVNEDFAELACTTRNGCNDPQRGGVGITRWSSACSTGWVMYRPGGRGVLTAGHCWHNEDGGVVKSTWSLGNLNSLNALREGTHADIRWITASDARPWVYGDNNNKARLVKQKSMGTIGGPVCMFGRNLSTPRCGTISSQNASHRSTATDYRVYGQHTGTFAAAGGDSGGAVAGSAYASTARGTVSAGSNGSVNYSWIGYASTYSMGNLVTG